MVNFMMRGFLPQFFFKVKIENKILFKSRQNASSVQCEWTLVPASPAGQAGCTRPGAAAGPRLSRSSAAVTFGQVPAPSLYLPLLLFCPPPFLASEKPSSIHCSVCLGARDRTDAEDVRKQRPRGKDIDSSRGSCEGQSQAPTLGSRGQRSRRGLTDSAVAMDTGPHRFLLCGHRTPVAATVLVIARHRNRLCPAPASSKYQLPRPSPGKCTRRLVPSSAFREGRASKTATFSSAVATGSAQAGGGTSEVGRSAGLACSGVPSRLLLFSKLDPSPDGRFVFPATWWYLPGRLRL